MAARLKEKYEKDVKPQLMERYRYRSPMEVPKLEKITLNMGVGEAKLNTSLLDAASEQLAVISGQKPSVRRARKSIANFKLREGMPVGVKVTLRGARMYEMLDRLQSIAIPRIRDFRGLNPRSFDGRGNYSLGIREQIIFPEVDYDSIDQVRGLDVTITTTAKSDDEAHDLLRLLGMPFRADGRPTPGTEQPEDEAEPDTEAPSEEPEPEAQAASEEAEPEEQAASEEAEPEEQAPSDEAESDAQVSSGEAAGGEEEEKG